MDQTANVVLTANTSQYQQQMDAASKSTQKALAGVVALSTAIGTLTTKAGHKIEILGASQVALLAGATASAAKFQQQMSQLQANSIMTSQSFKQTTQAVDSLRSSFAVTTTEAVQLVTQLTKMGQSQSSLRSLSETFIRLGAVTGESISGLVDGLIFLQRQMGVTGSQYTQRFASALATVSAAAGTSATSVLSFSNAIAPVAKVAGLSTNEILGVSAAFSKAGQDGYAAANAFNQMLTDITRSIQYGSPELSKYANILGITVSQFKNMPAAQSVVDIFNAINKQGPSAIKTLDALGIDGIRSIRAFQAVAAQGGLSTAINQAQQGYGDPSKFNKASADALSGLNDELEKLGNTLTEIGQAFGAGLLRPLTEVTKALNAVLSPMATMLQYMGNIPGIAAASAAGITPLAGGLLSMFTKLSAIGLGATILRGPLGAGIASGANITGGRFGKMATRARESYDAGTAGVFQNLLFGLGSGVGTAANYLRGAVGGGPEGGPGRISRLAGAGAGAVSRFMQYGLEPLYASNLMNPMRRQAMVGAPTFGAAVSGAWDKFKSAIGGNEDTKIAEGATKGLRNMVTELDKQPGALRGFANAMGSLLLSLGRATGGTALLGASAVGGAGVRLGGAALRGVGSFAANNPLLVGGALAYGAYSLYQHNKATNADIINDTSNFAPGQAYATALGQAAAATTTFATIVKQNAAAIGGTGGPSSLASATAVNAASIATATAPGRGLTNSAIGGLNKTQAIAFAQASLQGATPGQAQLLTYDLIRQYGPAGAQQILAAAQSGQGNLGTLVGAISPKSLRDTIKTGLGANVGSPVDANRSLITQVNQIVSHSGRILPSKAGSVFAVTGGTTQLLAGAMGIASNDHASINAIDKALNQAQNDPSKFQQFLSSSNSAAGRQVQGALGGLGGLSPGAQSFRPTTVGTANNPFFGLSDTELSTLRGLGAGSANALNANTRIGNQVSAASQSQGDANTLGGAARNLVSSMTGTTGSLSGTISELEKWKTTIITATDATYQLADAAQQRAMVLQQQGMARQTLPQQLGVLTQNLAGAQGAVSANPTADSQAQLDQAHDALVNLQNQAFQQIKQLALANQQFEISRQRGEADFALQAGRNQDDYDRQRGRQLRDYGIARSQQEADFQLSRKRQEEDFNHSLVLLAQQTSEAVYNVYQRITVQMTWSASNLLQNLQDQQDALVKQLDNLQTIRKAGVSGNVIKLLGLDQSTNAQQLARFVSDITQDPSLIAAFNKQAASRLKASKKLATDADNEQFQQMQYQFNLSLSRSQADFNKAQARQASSFQRQLSDQAIDYGIGISRMQQDFAKQLDRAQQDFNLQATDIGNSMGKLSTMAISALTGEARAQVQALLKALDSAGTQISAKVRSIQDNLVLDPSIGGTDSKDLHASAEKGTIMAQVQAVAKQAGWGSGAEWAALVNIINAESSFNPRAQNPSSSAYGLFQFVKSNWPIYGDPHGETAGQQTVGGLKYIRDRYGDPEKAWAFHKAKGWYAAGGVFGAGARTIGIGEGGAETVLPLNAAGSDFMVSMMKKYLTAARAANVANHSEPSMSKNITYNVKADHSTNFTGPISVQANDPDEMRRKLEAKKRLAALTGRK